MEFLAEQHKLALKWFFKNTGNIVGWPEKMSNGTLLVTKAKGIYKPKGSKYALSIRQNLHSNYHDKDIERLADGRWRYKYCPELAPGKKVEDYYTNRALLANMRDGVPVGVLIQVKPKPGPLYKVYGLGYVKKIEDGFFVLDSFDKSG